MSFWSELLCWFFFVVKIYYFDWRHNEMKWNFILIVGMSPSVKEMLEEKFSYTIFTFNYFRLRFFNPLLRNKNMIFS